MLCAEDEQSRTCWVTACRLLKVGPCGRRVCVCQPRGHCVGHLLVTGCASALRSVCVCVCEPTVTMHAVTAYKTPRSQHVTLLTSPWMIPFPSASRHWALGVEGPHMFFQGLRSSHRAIVSVESEPVPDLELVAFREGAGCAALCRTFSSPALISPVRCQQHPSS